MGCSCCDEVAFARAAVSAGQVLRVFSIEKARGDILSRAGFDKVAAALSLELAEAAAEIEEDMLGDAMDALDMDWTTLTAAQREVAIAAALALMPQPATVAAATQAAFEGVLPGILDATRSAAKLPASFTSKLGVFQVEGDTVAQYLRDSQALFITNALKQRNQALSEQVRSIVARGLEEGWRRQDIVSALEKAVGPSAVLGRSAHYWDTVASVFTGRARSYGLLTAYRDAGVHFYTIEAVLDEVTCDVCRFFHGQSFPTADALALMERQALHPESAKDIAPWVRAGRNDMGEKVLFTKIDGVRFEFAKVLRSGVGVSDDEGDYETTATPLSLMTKGVSIPPFHGLCRCTLVAS